MKHTKSMIYAPSIESRELQLFASNTERIYNANIRPAMEALYKHFKRGTYDHEKAIDAFYYVAEAAARLYSKWYSIGQVFSVTDRYTAAVDLLNEYEEQIKNHDF